MTKWIELVRRLALDVCVIGLCMTRAVSGQEHPMTHAMPDSSATHAMMMMTGPLGISMNRMASGTTWIPDAVPLAMHHTMSGKWELMSHGNAFVQYNNQGSDRGADQLGSLNWAMLMASRKVNTGLFQGRTMISLEPATVGSRGYPLLLQTGESNKGAPLHDRQHPHDFWMEVAALYQVPLNSRLAVELYVAPSGEPALGPVAYMHRPSAVDNPLAPIGHHWQDATHITFGVVTAGLYSRQWKLEGSVFNGREPNDQRWNFDPIRLDSFAGRLTVNPDSQWSMTAGYGYIDSPESLRPEESIHRWTASLINARKLTNGQWVTSLVWGANDVSAGQGWTNTALLESEVIFRRHNTVFGRAEFARKSAEELVLPPIVVDEAATFPLGSLSLGYIRDVVGFLGATGGFGLLGTVNRVSGSLIPFYGTRTPLGGWIFFRVRPAYPSKPAMPTAEMHGHK
ncbi:MAG TPA: hypothetical protein VIP11_24465 [Gemmatimonadaceae bacterium]